ncbi:hypothetical protein Sjap_014789 [Stephania japonica]|uniref:Uncharacterized protein n=1 Tax=Stephania japonica TaxID=461633 RepID=A0AAP0II85_9MAGN
MLTSEQAADFKRRRQRGKAHKRWDRGSQGSGTTSHFTSVVPQVSYVASAQSSGGGRSLPPPPVMPALPALERLPLPAPRALRQHQQ